MLLLLVFLVKRMGIKGSSFSILIMHLIIVGDFYLRGWLPKGLISILVMHLIISKDMLSVLSKLSCRLAITTYCSCCYQVQEAYICNARFGGMVNVVLLLYFYLVD